MIIWSDCPWFGQEGGMFDLNGINWVTHGLCKGSCVVCICDLARAKHSVGIGITDCMNGWLAIWIA